MHFKKITKCHAYISLIEKYAIHGDEYAILIAHIKRVLSRLSVGQSAGAQEQHHLLFMYHLLTMLLERATIDASVTNLLNFIKTDFLSTLHRNYKISCIPQFMHNRHDQNRYDANEAIDRCANKILNIKKRSKFPRPVVKILRGWLENNIRRPYPNKEEKLMLAQQTSLSIIQVENWFINARRRYLK